MPCICLIGWFYFLILFIYFCRFCYHITGAGYFEEWAWLDRKPITKKKERGVDD
jgi:hypothetical protein